MEFSRVQSDNSTLLNHVEKRKLMLLSEITQVFVDKRLALS